VKELSNKALIEKLVSRNKTNRSKVLNFLKDEMAVKVHRQIKNRGGTREDAEEALNEALYVTFKYAKEDRFKPNTDIRGFIYRVAGNHYYGQSNNRSNIPTVSLDEFVKEIPEKDGSIDKPNIQSEKLKAAMSLLSTECQQVLIAFYFERKSMQIIMTEFGLGSQQSAKTKKLRCFKKLKDLIKNE